MDEKTKKTGVISKLKSKLDRMLGRKEKQSINISYKAQDDTPSVRKAYRTYVDNMHVILRNPRIKCHISDISATGIGFSSSRELPVGEILEAVLLWSGKPVIKALKIKVVRHCGNTIGCQFHELDRSQDKVISKIVLAAQKRAIQNKHGQKSECIEQEVEEEIKKENRRKPAPKTDKKIKI